MAGERAAADPTHRRDTLRRDTGPADDALTRLQLVIRALTTGSDDTLFDLFVQQAVAAAGAANGVLALVEADRLRVISSTYAPETVAAFEPLLLDEPLPIVDAARSGEPVWLGDAEQGAARYPGLAAASHLTPASASLPLRIEGNVLGALGVAFDGPHDFAPAERSLLLALADQAALFVDRRRLLEPSVAVHDLIDSLPIPAALVDRELRFAHCNERLAVVNRVPVSRHVGRFVRDVLPTLPEHVLDAYREVLETGERRVGIRPEHPASVMVHNDRQFVVHCIPAWDAAHEPAVLVLLDRVPLAPSSWDVETRLLVSESLIDRAPIGIAFFDTDRRFRMVNRALATMNGYLPNDHVGRTIDELLPSIAGAANEVFDTVLGEREPVLHREFSGETPAEPGEPGTWDESWYPVHDTRGALLGAASLVVETTDFKRALARADVVRELATRLAIASTVTEVADTTVRLLVDHLAGSRGSIVIVDPHARTGQIVAWRGYRDDEVASWSPIPLDVPLPIVQATQTRAPIFISSSAEFARVAPAAVRFAERSGDRAVVVMPLLAGDECLGTVGVAFPEEHEFDADERTLLETVAAIAAAALERTRRDEAERETSLTLQRSLLPESLPEVAGIQACAEYRPGHGAAVGGDWYECFVTHDKVVLAVGDVAGNGVRAAATMGKLRNLMRGVAHVDPAPTVVLQHTQLLARSIPDCFATVALAVYEPATRMLEVALAGHAPPIVVDPDGSVRFVGGGARVPPIGVQSARLPRSAKCMLRPGSVLLLYTDGAFERRTESVDTGLERLAACAARVYAPVPARAFAGSCRRILDEVLPAHERADDVCLLAIRVS